MAKNHQTRRARRNAQRKARNEIARQAMVELSELKPEHPPERSSEPDALEWIKGELTRAEYQAGLTLRRLWHAGTLNPPAAMSCVATIGCPPAGDQDIPDDRLDANDKLRRALRAMGMMGMTGRLCVEVVCYDRPVTTDEELRWVRSGLSRLGGRA